MTAMATVAQAQDGRIYDSLTLPVDSELHNLVSVDQPPVDLGTDAASSSPRSDLRTLARWTHQRSRKQTLYNDHNRLLSSTVFRGDYWYIADFTGVLEAHVRETRVAA
jgi:hypothetical protein